MGGYWSRCITFLPSPSRLLAYLRSEGSAQSNSVAVHNPLGALSVFAFLTALIFQGLSGFMSDDDISISGPWAALVPNSWVGLATKYHTEIGYPLIFLLVGVHILAVLYYLFIKKQNLIRPMIDGDKFLSPDTVSSRDNWQTRCIAGVIFAACAYVVYKLVLLNTAA